MSEELYYVQNRGFSGNCLLWWKPEGHGYTCDIRNAWKVSRKEAERICRSRPLEDKMWPASLVEAHVVHHVTERLLSEAKP